MIIFLFPLIVFILCKDKVKISTVKKNNIIYKRQQSLICAFF